MLLYFICYFDYEIDDNYCVYVLDQHYAYKLLKIFPDAHQIKESEAYYMGWSLPLKKEFWIGGFASTRPYFELEKLSKQEIIREAIHATYLTLLRASRFKHKSVIDKLELMLPIDFFL